MPRRRLLRSPQPEHGALLSRSVVSLDARGKMRPVLWLGHARQRAIDPDALAVLFPRPLAAPPSQCLSYC